MTSPVATARSISVVIPLFNHERYIERALQSVFDQTEPATEIIVVDDGSTDNSAALVREICKTHPELVFWTQPNQGAHRAINAGIHRATGEFVSILNSDDEYSHARLAECLTVFDRDPAATAVTTSVTYIDAAGTEFQNSWYLDARAFFDQTRNLPLSLINGNFFVSTSNLFVRRSAFAEIGFFSDLRYAHDLDFFLRLLARGKSIHFLDKALLRYRSHETNTIRESDKRARSERAAAIASYLIASWHARGREPEWSAEFRTIRDLIDRLAFSPLVDHFIQRLQFLALPHQSGGNAPDLMGRGLPEPLADEMSLAELSEQCLRLEAANSNLSVELEAKRKAFAEQEMNIAEIRAELEEKRVAFAEQETNIRGIRNELEEKRLALDLQERNIEGLRSELQDLRANTVHLQSLLSSKDQELATLRNHAASIQSEIDAYKGTRAYRLNAAWSSEQPFLRRSWEASLLLAGAFAPRQLKQLVRATRERNSRAEGPSVDAPAPERQSDEPADAYRVRIPVPATGNRPRVVHAIANFCVGGSSRLVVDLFERLGADYQQEVVTSFIPSPPAYVGLAIHEFRDASHGDALRAYLERVRPDVVHVHYWGDCDFGWYDMVFRSAIAMGCRIIENINTPVAPYVDARIGHYVYVSDYVLEHFGERGPKSEVIYPGSDFDLFAAPRDRLPASDCIGMVYRLERDKLDEHAIDPFIHALKRRPGTRALIVGGGSLLESFRSSVSAANLTEFFTFTGYVPYEALPGLYAQMTLFVAPVWKESFGQVSPFAMSVGLPVAGYDVGALAEILGSRDCLAPPGDAQQLAQVIVDLLDHPERSLAIGRANQERAHSRFSVQAMISRYADLYRRALG